ncbi:YgaP family membrane protein [Schinkia azotoformans]|uniref:YgaP family membrane protein n=1 Tax=Schinkia azotoformans TaxID=1454 RepID=UPI002DBB8D28|nr:DUF2892 domain-containing protein [Schinkia azotoformans]MEC1719133.1 DUF2892 domain-containing protein [Schinkia azotoformans]MEC1741733.1 DUF2892 domain-containing protein [Schinkia azotoformans]MEC1766589.1 DUF2892 domain-containing protein [Schinkia azotoformans]MEC1788004.1 DUF2892 domain-containing protein [Schinkia azotoformans]MED4354362.1 DUF2892 domain-containing protein [Schinkia azotoformans]
MNICPSKGSIIHLLAGIFVLGSVLLSIFVNSNWLFFTGFVGFMLIIASLTGFCPLALILKAIGVKEEKCCVRN